MRPADGVPPLVHREDDSTGDQQRERETDQAE
jgi:hypothetical protein